MKDLLIRALPYVPADLAEEIHEALQKPAGRAMCTQREPW